MTLVDLNTFLARAQADLLPDPFNPARITGLFPQAVPVVDADRSAQNVEMATLQFSMATTATPGFTVLPSIDSVSEYRYIGVRSAIDQIWTGAVEYPGLLFEFQVFRQKVAVTGTDPITANPLCGDITRKIYDQVDADTKTYSLLDKPLRIYPRGVLRLFANGDEVTGTSIAFQYVREALSNFNQIKFPAPGGSPGSIAGVQF